MKRNQDIIRKASVADIPRLMDLLHQVNMVHHHLRPELFKPNTTKYSEQELETLLGDESKPIFVYDEGEVLGYAFCQITQVKNSISRSSSLCCMTTTASRQNRTICLSVATSTPISASLSTISKLPPEKKILNG